jgi:hypothetical protein
MQHVLSAISRESRHSREMYNAQSVSSKGPGVRAIIAVDLIVMEKNCHQFQPCPSVTPVLCMTAYRGVRALSGQFVRYAFRGYNLQL